MNCLCGAIAVNPRKAVGLCISETSKSRNDGGVVIGMTAANPVRLITIAQGQALRDNGRGDFDQQGQVGQQAAAADPMEIEHFGVRQPAAAALIGPTGINKPIADDPFPALKRRNNQPLDMVGTRGSEK